MKVLLFGFGFFVLGVLCLGERFFELFFGCGVLKKWILCWESVEKGFLKGEKFKRKKKYIFCMWVWDCARLRTPNIKDNWKIGLMWQTKYASTVQKNLGVRKNFQQCSEGYLLSGRLQSVGLWKDFFFKFCLWIWVGIHIDWVLAPNSTD